MGDSYRPNRAPLPPRGAGGRYDDSRRRDARPHHNGQRDGGFTFRGAATDGYPRHPPEFSFRSGPQPHFPSEQPAPRRPRNQPNQTRDRRPPPPHRRDGRQPAGPPPRRFIPRPAHARDLLRRTDRSTTPEQLPGMNGDNNKPRFAEYISSGSDEEYEPGEEIIEDNSKDEARPSSQKRVKTDVTEDAAESAHPKWSNPDPYSVLPPTFVSNGPKKDIVQVIRKAKIEAAAQANSVNSIKENVDFISFESTDVDDEEEEGEISSNESVGPRLPPSSIMSTDVDLNVMHAAAPRSTKRKRGAETQSSQAGEIVENWQSLPDKNPVPWYKPVRPDDRPLSASDGLRHLHEEILDFYHYNSPSRHEETLRREIIERVEYACQSWRGEYDTVQVLSFGSFAAGLYLPTADMDLVAVSQDYLRAGFRTFCSSKTQMYNLSRYLIRYGLVKAGSMVPIVHARVPILKYVDAKTELKVDISFENDSGLHAKRTFLAWKEQFPDMPVLVVLIKQLLAMRDLNEVVNGGIGGFTTICLVVSMLQMMPESQRVGQNPDTRYAELLLHFLDLYGNKFDIKTTGITLNPPGYFDKRRDYCTAKKINMSGLTIVDPNRPENDISGGSRNINAVLQCFRGAFKMIQERLRHIGPDNPNTGSILEPILGGNYTSFDETHIRLRRLHQDRVRSPLDPMHPPLSPPLSTLPNTYNVPALIRPTAPSQIAARPPPWKLNSNFQQGSLAPASRNQSYHPPHDSHVPLQPTTQHDPLQYEESSQPTSSMSNDTRPPQFQPINKPKVAKQKLKTTGSNHGGTEKAQAKVEKKKKRLAKKREARQQKQQSQEKQQQPQAKKKRHKHQKKQKA